MKHVVKAMNYLNRLDFDVIEQNWPHTMDAQIWANEWEKAFINNPDIASDKGCMIGWFANAIMAGYDTAFEKLESNAEASQNGVNRNTTS